jgi:hypothetical protein
MHVNQLRDGFIETKAVVCRGCPHALGQPRVSDRKFFCGKLFNGRWDDRAQPGYLPLVVTSVVPACPINLHPHPTKEDFRPKDEPPPNTDALKNALFHELWAEIHDPTRHWTPFWFGTIRHKLPCGECKQELVAYVKANPIPYGDDAACWRWGVDLHNAVNARLGKPVYHAPDAVTT